MKAKTQEARLVEGKVGLFQNGSIKGRQRTPCHKDCLALSILLKGFIDTQGEGKNRKEKLTRQLQEKALPRSYSAQAQRQKPLTLPSY